MLPILLLVLGLAARGAPSSDDEIEVDSAGGLSAEQVVSALEPVLPRAARCAPRGARLSAVLSTYITVASTGRVAAVEVDDRDGLPAPMVECVRQVLLGTRFPAHQLPEGFEFGYPIRFESRGEPARPPAQVPGAAARRIVSALGSPD